MRRDSYLKSRHVPEFINWLENKLDALGSFKHGYFLKKAGENWRCSCLYEAYETTGGLLIWTVLKAVR